MTTDTASRDLIVAVTTDYIADELRMDPAGIAGDDVLRELPGADSMKMLRLVSKLERHWDVEFDDEAIFALRTVDELVALVEKSVTAP
jgi:acyl carrier protein